jgi:iron complex transport system substrate-binding protein
MELDVRAFVRLPRHSPLSPRRLAVALFAAAMTACGGLATGPDSPSVPPPPPPGSAGAMASPVASVAFPITVTDDEGTAVTIGSEPLKIVSLTPAVTEILFALGVGDHVVGRVEDTANYPPEAEAVPVVGSFDSVDVEAVVGGDPDLVIAGGSGGTPADAIDRLRSLGVPVVVVYASDVEGVLHDIELTGTAVGRPEEAADLVAEMTSGFDAVADAVAGAPRPRVFYETGDQPAIYGIAQGSVYAEMIQLAGGEPITTGSPTDWEMPIEALLAADPELIILGDSAYGVTAEAVSTRPGWDVMTAVETGAIKPIDDIVVTRPGPRLVDGLRLLAEAIHPERRLPSPGAPGG